MRQVIIHRLIRKAEVIKAESRNNSKIIQDMEEFIALLEILERTKDE